MYSGNVGSVRDRRNPFEPARTVLSLTSVLPIPCQWNGPWLSM